MGYMGFGMRKEVYTRKPKEVFKRLKKIYGPGASVPKSNIKLKTQRPVSYEKHTYKPFYQTRFYKITKLIILAILVGLLLLSLAR